MTDPHSQQAIADLAALCDHAADPSARAAGLLRGLARVVPHAAAAVSFVDRRTGKHRLLANRGYTGPVLDYLLGAFVVRDQGWRTVRAHPDDVLCWRDVPGYRQQYSAREVFGAQGYAEGTSICLLDRDGVLAGALHMSVREPELPDSSLESLAALRGAFAELAATSAGQAVSGLSSREVEILGLVAAGMSNAEIAERLVLARRTVATHVEHILAKLEARNRVEASVRALRLGLV